MASKKVGKYQLFGKLRDEEYTALEADIAKRGVQVPVEVDQDGNVLDGHHRQEIADRLEKPYKTIVRKFQTEAEKREHVIKLNLARRHMEPWQWGQAFKMLLEERGVVRGAGRKTPEQEGKAETVSALASELGVDDRTARNRMAADDAREKLPAKAKREVQAGTKTLAEAKREQTEEQKMAVLEQKAAEATLPDQPSWILICQDVLEGLASVRDHHSAARLIFADPPYNIGVDYGSGKKADLLPDAEYLDWCETWLKACVECLAEDGSLWVMIGDTFAAEYGVILKRIGLHVRSWIKWYETFGVNCTNNFNRTSRHIFYCVRNPKRFVFNPKFVTRPSDRQTKYKDKRAAPGGKLLDDVWTDIPRLVGTAKERLPVFPTQLPVALVQRIVECASQPADLVVDPFCGSASVGVACLRTKEKRRFVGIDQSKKFIALATKRMKSEPHDI